jgi:hypothetical protein
MTTPGFGGGLRLFARTNKKPQVSGIQRRKPALHFLLRHQLAV